jgi:hypothetical protein
MKRQAKREIEEEIVFPSGPINRPLAESRYTCVNRNEKSLAATLKAG